jgi:hypothetical protein
MAAVDRRVTSWQVVLCQVQACPEQLGPNVVGDDAWIRADLRTNTARRCERSEWIEPQLAPLPFLAVAEERSKGPQIANFGAWHQRLAETPAEMTRVGPSPITNPETIDGGDARSSCCAGPRGRLDNAWVSTLKPAAHFYQDPHVLLTCSGLERRRLEPAARPRGPCIRRARGINGNSAPRFKGAEDGLWNDAHLGQDARNMHDDGAQFAMGAIPGTFHSFGRQVS